MGIGVSIFLIAIGAILKFAVNADITGVDLPMVGVILMVVGGVMALLQLLSTSRQRSGRSQPSSRDQLYDGESPPQV